MHWASVYGLEACDHNPDVSPACAGSPEVVDAQSRRSCETCVMCMFEVAKPPAQRRVELCNDLVQTPATRPTRLLTNLVPQRLQTFRAHIPPSACKPVAQEIKARGDLLGCFDNPGFLRMKTQAVLLPSKFGPRPGRPRPRLGCGTGSQNRRNNERSCILLATPYRRMDADRDWKATD